MLDPPSVHASPYRLVARLALLSSGITELRTSFHPTAASFISLFSHCPALSPAMLLLSTQRRLLKAHEKEGRRQVPRTSKAKVKVKVYIYIITRHD